MRERKRLRKTKNTFIDVVKRGKSIKKIIEGMASDRIEWQKRIHVTDLD